MLRQGIWWIVFSFWLVIFFPKWYFITYTKIRELRQLVGQSETQQIQSLHSEEMDLMLDVAQSVKGEETTILVPPAGTYPILSAGALWRYVMGGSELLVSPRALDFSVKKLIVLVPDVGKNWQPTQSACQQGGCGCFRWPAKEVEYWRVP